MNQIPALISVENLSVGFKVRSGKIAPILRNIDISVNKGETLGLVGESGSGKSTLALAMMGYLKKGLLVMNGSTSFRDRNTFELSVRELENIRGGELALIPQNAGQSLTPTLRIGAQLVEALKLHSQIDASQYQARAVELLTQVRLPDPQVLLSRYPHQLSGGQQQRVAIAMALAGEPEALLLDEPTTGLDVTTQAHVLELLRDLAQETQTAMVYVSHDLGAIARVCDRVAVMYAGEIVLQGSTRQVLLNPVHPYARGLLASIPKLKDSRFPAALEGRPPMPGAAGNGCGFADRCGLAQSHCFDQHPQTVITSQGESVRCHRHDEVIALSGSIEGSPITRPQLDDQSCELGLNDLAISYTKPSFLDLVRRKKSTLTPTVEGINIRLRKGETIGLVGESGSGKSTILRAIAGLLAPLNGSIVYGEKDELASNVDHRSDEQRRKIQLIFQNPDDSLNPRQTIFEILEQPLQLYFGLTGTELRNRCIELLEKVRLGAHYLERLPGQLSGGEKQRVAIARAFAAEPELVLCDEVTSALDVSVQAAVLTLLNDLRNEQGTTYVFVSHDLAVVRALSDRVAVLYQGRLCEIGPAKQVYAQPTHPYTQALLGAVLEPDPDTRPTLSADDVVELSPPAKGCAFQRRCQRRVGDICDNEKPPWQAISPGHQIRCHIKQAS